MRRRNGQFPLFGGSDNPLRDRVLRIALDGRSQRKCIVGIEVVGSCDVNNTKLASSKRTRLVEDNGVDQTRVFKTSPVSYEETALSRQRCRNCDDEWDCKS